MNVVLICGALPDTLIVYFRPYLHTSHRNKSYARRWTGETRNELPPSGFLGKCGLYWIPYIFVRIVSHRGEGVNACSFRHLGTPLVVGHSIVQPKPSFPTTSTLKGLFLAFLLWSMVRNSRRRTTPVSTHPSGKLFVITPNPFPIDPVGRVSDDCRSMILLNPLGRFGIEENNALTDKGGWCTIGHWKSGCLATWSTMFQYTIVGTTMQNGSKFWNFFRAWCQSRSPVAFLGDLSVAVLEKKLLSHP